MASYASQKYEGILTCDDDEENILRTPTSFLDRKDWGIARLTIEKLRTVRNNVLKGGAGLAAPQIGILLPIFIYTPNRTTEGLIDVINPSFEPLEKQTVDGYEACFSEPFRCTRLTRWKAIKCRYQDLTGQWQDVILKDFAAKVFQHEMDHFQGKLTVDHPSAKTETFAEEQAFKDYMNKVLQDDSKTYEAS
ncbi:MAG: peptide deformylase [Alphaproteobacteria bacterium]|nr:peptide deformylase [Alphaproteobacteria bacterium]